MLPEPLQPATQRAVLTGLLPAVLPLPELVGRRGAPAVARLLPVAGFPSSPVIGDELGVAGLVAAFLGIEDGAALLAARWRLGVQRDAARVASARTSRVAAWSRAAARRVRWAARSS